METSGGEIKKGIGKNQAFWAGLLWYGILGIYSTNIIVA